MTKKICCFLTIVFAIAIAPTVVSAQYDPQRWMYSPYGGQSIGDQFGRQMQQGKSQSPGPTRKGVTQTQQNTTIQSQSRNVK